MTKTSIRNGAPLAALIMAVVGIIFDYITPLGVAAGVIHILFVLTAIWFRSPRTAFFFAGIGTVFTLKGYLLISDIQADTWIVQLNRALSVLALWVVALIVYFQKRMANALEQSEARHSAFIDNAIDGMITINNQGIIQKVNPACEKIFGYVAEEMLGQNVNILMPEPYHSEHNGYLQNYRNSGFKKIIGIGRELEGMRKDGSTFPIDLSVSEMSLKSEQLFGGIVRDVTARKEAERSLNRTMEDLKLSNDELEKFAYVASHDLKSPLRGIDNLTKWLAEDLAEVLDDENKDRLEKLQGRVLRMERLLDDLLEYSRAGRNLKKTEKIKADRLIDDVRSLLNVPAEIAITADESLDGILIPRMPLEQIFHNLIGNAVKHHDKEKGIIVVSASESTLFYEFSVQDDGPGIAERFQEKIFEMFQTLKPRDEVEGSGMGLALVKKIVYRFGGRIQVKSKEGKGATFTFTWPKKPKIRSITI